MKPVSSKAHRAKDLFVIGCGFPKTGIASLSEGLSELNFCSYNQRNLTKTRHHIPLWHQAAALKTELKQKKGIQSFADWNATTLELDEFDWNQLFAYDVNQKYNAVVGGAATAFYLDIMEYAENEGYDTRIVLTYRSKADLADVEGDYSIENLQSRHIATAWYSNQEWLNRPGSQTIGLTVAKSCMASLLFNESDLLFFDDEANCKAKYKAWIDSVIEHVPKEKLLLFNVNDGYEPLCEFLGMHIPQYVDYEPKPFPHLNDSASKSPFKQFIDYFL